MGKCFVLCKQQKQDKVLRIVKTDGKVLELRAPTLVKHILANFPSCSGIGLSNKASEPLPPNYQLKLGKVYYVIPLPGSVHIDASSVEKESAAVATRIKIVISKQQLQQLLTNRISVQQVLSVSASSRVENKSSYSVDSSTSWKPKLDTIPELEGISE